VHCLDKAINTVPIKVNSVQTIMSTVQTEGKQEAEYR